MNRTREKFESLDKVKEILNNDKHISFDGEFYFHEIIETFTPEEIIFLNAAFYAFNDRQKKIDEALEYVIFRKEMMVEIESDSLEWYLNEQNTQTV